MPVRWTCLLLCGLQVYSPLELLLFIAGCCTIADSFVPQLMNVPKATVTQVVRAVLSMSFVVGASVVVFNLKSRFCKEQAWNVSEAWAVGRVWRLGQLIGLIALAAGRGKALAGHVSREGRSACFKRGSCSGPALSEFVQVPAMQAGRSHVAHSGVITCGYLPGGLHGRLKHIPAPPHPLGSCVQSLYCVARVAALP